MLQLIRYTARRTKKGLVHESRGVIGVVPGDPENQIRAMAEILYPMVFNEDGSIKTRPEETSHDKAVKI